MEDPTLDRLQLMDNFLTLVKDREKIKESFPDRQTPYLDEAIDNIIDILDRERASDVH